MAAVAEEEEEEEEAAETHQSPPSDVPTFAFQFKPAANVKAVAVSRPNSWEKRPEGGNPERK